MDHQEIMGNTTVTEIAVQIDAIQKSQAVYENMKVYLIKVFSEC